MRRFERILQCLFVILWVTLSVGAQAGVYKWVDKQGRVHFGEQPPKDVAVEAIALPKSKAPVTPDISDIERRERQQKIVETLSSERKERELARKDAAAKKKKHKAACAKLETKLKESDKVNIYYRRNEKGEREFISDKERNRLIAEVKEKYKSKCK